MFVGCLVLLLLLSSPDLVVQNCRAFLLLQSFPVKPKNLEIKPPSEFPTPQKLAPPASYRFIYPSIGGSNDPSKLSPLQQNDEVSKPSKHTVPLSRSPKGSPSFGTTSAGGVASPDRSLSVEPAYHSA